MKQQAESSLQEKTISFHFQEKKSQTKVKSQKPQMKILCSFVQIEEIEE